jgi:hypothetical protein
MAWTRPSRLSEDEAELWLHRELRRLAELPDVESVVLTRVERSHQWDWVCELHLLAEADAERCVENGAWTEWMLDLRLLGMRPVFAVLGAGQEVS